MTCYNISLYYPVLQNVASRFVACKADVEDIVQDTFIKWLSMDKKDIKNAKAYLIKSTINNSLDHIKALKNKKLNFLKREEFCLLESEIIVHQNHTLDTKIDVAYGLRVLQQRLAPLERAVYLLREVFSIDYDSLQEMLQKSNDHCRQLLSRAKLKLAKKTTQVQLQPLTLLSSLKVSFEKACLTGSLSDLVADLQKDIRDCVAVNKNK